MAPCEFSCKRAEPCSAHRPQSRLYRPFSTTLRGSQTYLRLLRRRHFQWRLRMERGARIHHTGSWVFLDHEVGRIVLDIGDLGIDDGHAATGIAANPQTMPRVRSDSVVGNVHVFEADIGKRALTVLAARSDNAQAVGETILDVHVADVHAGNAAAIHAKLEGGPPGPIVVESAAANHIAIPNHRRSAEIVVNLPALVRGRESRADQDAAAGGDVL